MFNPHLQGVSNELMQSMCRIGRKAAELERSKLQTEIQKERSEIQRKQLEKHLSMATKNPGKGGPVQNPRKSKEVDEEIEDLEMLMEEQTDKWKRKTAFYMQLSTGEWVTKGEDRQA